MSEVGYSRRIEFVLRGVLLSTSVHTWIDVCVWWVHMWSMENWFLTPTCAQLHSTKSFFLYCVLTFFFDDMWLHLWCLAFQPAYVHFNYGLKKSWPKNERITFFFKPLSLYGTQKKKFWKMFMLPFSIQWKWMGTRDFELQKANRSIKAICKSSVGLVCLIKVIW